MITIRLNSWSLAGAPFRTEISKILQAALDAAEPAASVQRLVSLSGSVITIAGRDYPLLSPGRLILVGAGKAAAGMARGVVEAVGDVVSAGVLIVKHLPGSDHDRLPPTVRLFVGEHPLPGEGSLAGTHAMVELLSTCRPEDVVICLISGGGSALLTMPQPGISLADIRQVTGLLLASGAEIGEMNILRRHLDRVKGGGLARMVAPAALISLILSDVIGSPLPAIASGPTAADESTFQDALNILSRYGLSDRIPASVHQILSDGTAGRIAETLKPADPILAGVQNLVVASNVQSAEVAVASAIANGFHASLLTTSLKGEAREVGLELGRILRQTTLPRPFCLVAGGETTVTLRGSGRGGRNQELALSAALEITGMENVMIITLATDGEDGPTDAAGAVVTGKTLARAAALGLDPIRFLAANDSYTFFAALDDLLLPGPTGTNVNDLTFLFAF